MADLPFDTGLFIYGEFNKLVAAREAGRGRLTLCSCDPTESLAGARLWRYGREHLANAALGAVVPYREPRLNRSARGVDRHLVVDRKSVVCPIAT